MSFKEELQEKFGLVHSPSETTLGSVDVYVKSQYTINGNRNRLNSGILRTQFIILNDPIDKGLTNEVFTGIELLQNNQYVLVRQEEKKEIWKAYQGDAPNKPIKLYESITLTNFFDLIHNQASKTSIAPILNEQEMEKKFVIWMGGKLKSDGTHYNEQYQSQAKNYLKYQIGNLVPSSNAGNLFRFHNINDFESKCKSILQNTSFQALDAAKHNQLSSALSLYLTFLKNFQKANFSYQNNGSKGISNFTPSQIIYYGVPGCGKSNKIREKLKDVPEKNKVRVVFHPEYTNAEFIGQILPKVNGHVTYEFTPGPFTQIIKRAYLNPNEHFYLVIEEINRGNAAAIFGDTFQLLDRLKTGETDSLGNDPANATVNTFTEGWSQYFVQNDDINAYIRGSEDSIQIGSIRFDSNTAIRLPPNLSILATMNTSDQNVFTLDNAFQRRFDMELVRNEFDLTKPAVNAQYNAEIDDTGIKWGQFWGWINAKITATLKGLSSTEDKRLGVWFVSNAGGIIDDKVFAEKVLKFLWDDVFKFKRPQIFADGIDTLEKLINSFEKPSEGKERFDVFKDKANLVAFVASPTL